MPVTSNMASGHLTVLSFAFPIDFAMVMSTQAASGLDSVSASRRKKEVQT